MWILRDKLYNYSLVDITLPGTHDSGSYELVDAIGPGESTVVDDLIRVANKAGLPIFPFVRGWGQSQNTTVYQQLLGGIRYIDLRVCVYNSGWFTLHFLLGNQIQLILNDIRQFLDRHPGEVIVVELGDFAGSSTTERDFLGKMINDTLGRYLFPASPTGDLRQITIGQMVERNQRILMTSPFRLGPYLWNGTQFLCGGYADKSVLGEMVAWNYQEISRYGGTGSLFEVSWTLTPQPKDIEKDLYDPFDRVRTLKDLALGADAALASFVDKYHNYKIGNIMLVDWWEYADVVDIAISQNLRLCNDDPVYIPWSTDGQYCRNWFVNGNCSNPIYERWMSIHCSLSCGYC